MGLSLDSSIQFLKGVGPHLADLFERHGVRTIQDLLEFYPRTYEDRRAARNIASLRADELVSVKARLVKVQTINLGHSGRKMFDVTLSDDSGKIHCRYFRSPYRGYFERLKPGQEVRVVGKVSEYRGNLEFHHPDIKDVVPDEVNEDALLPVYVEIEGLSSFKIQKLMALALSQVQREITETLPPALIESFCLLPRELALSQIHQPPIEQAQSFFSQRSQAHQRLIFEEFFWLEIFLAAKQTGFKKEQGPKIVPALSQVDEALAQLPFQLTGAQFKTLSEIRGDFGSGHPMNRLVQGDVGSGKTIVAFLSAKFSIQAGYQACLMAPTEILAEQHFRNAEKIFVKSGERIALLTGRTKASERKNLLEKLSLGQIDFLLGTHALIENPVVFNKLGLVIVDEQHRFGVQQRAQLKNKGSSPHFLVMTATPIPRTLAMTVYGDLDVSVIDELPPGRTAIETRVTGARKKQQVMDFLREQISKGRQAYVIYPLVEASEKLDLKNASDEFEQLKSFFPDLRVDLLHGRMSPEHKELVMGKFRQGETQILVSTTVVEVGVDVANANIIIVEHAERFGLSQLHQLRGRVGRGAHKSFCILVLGVAVSHEARERTEFMEKTTDGFRIAEFDLQMRGPGEFMGTRQSGLDGFKLANLIRDVELLQKARTAAFKILETDPKLSKPEHQGLRAALLKTHGPLALAAIG
jgi:ATP-dependent DNA helicase RecG